MDLSYLSTLDKPSFEAERNRLIADHILKADPRQREMLVKLQLSLDRAHDTMTSEDFLGYCMVLLAENLANLSDHITMLKSKVSPPPILSAAER